MFLNNYKPTSPSRRWARHINGHFIRIPVDPKRRMPYIGHQGETKKVKRSRRIGPAQQFHNTERSQQEYGGWGRVVGLSKSARTSHLVTLIENAIGIQYYTKAYHGNHYNQGVAPTRGLRYHRTHRRAGAMQYLKFLPIGTYVFNVPLRDNAFSWIARAAGTYCKLLGNCFNVRLATIRIPSSKVLRISFSNLVTTGRNANKYFFRTVRGSARCTRLRYKKAISVRGIAKNPVDHPNGGRANTKQPLKNPWGRPAKNSK